MGLLRLYLRRLRSERLPALAIAGLVLVTALLLALGPRLLERLSNEALVSELQSAPAVERSLVVNESSRPSADVPETLDKAKERVGTLAGEFPAGVNNLITDERFVADSTSWEALSGTQFQSLFFLRVQQDIEQHVTLVEGRLPAGRTSIAPDPRPGSLPTQRAIIYEVMLSEATAKEIGVTVDQDIPLLLTIVDSRNAGVDLTAIARIVGIYRITDPDDPFWLGDSLVSSFRFHPVGSNTVYVESDAILATDAYGALQNHARNSRLPLSFQWRYYFDVSRIDATRTGELEASLRRFDSHPPRSGVSEVPTDTTVRSGLLRLLLAHEARWTSAAALLGVVGMGALFVAATCLALVALLASGGRRRTSALALARGAGSRSVRVMLALEALILSLPAALLAIAIAALIVPNAGWLVSSAAASLVVVAAVVLLIATGVPAGGPAAAGRGGDRATPRGARTGIRQLVAESALVIGAVIAAVVLRERGLANLGGDSTVRADPLMVAVPALVGLAAGVLALRGYPLITGLIARLSFWGRGLVFSLASKRAARARSSAAVLLSIIATASVAGFAIAGWTTLDQAAQQVGWQAVGAPFLVTASSGSVPASFDASKVAGVTAASPASALPAVIGGQPMTLVAVDAARYQAVVNGTPADVHFPSQMMLGAAPDAQEVPAIVSANLGLKVGDRGGIVIGATTVTVKAVAIRPAFALTDEGDRFAVVATDQLNGIAPDLDVPTTAVFVGAPQSAAPALQSVVDANPNLELTSQAVVASTLATTPVSQAVSFGLAAAALAAAAYAALAVAAAFVLAAADQRTETSYLRVMGLSRGQRLRLIFAEHVPAALLAAIGGGALGLLVFNFIRPGLGLPTIMPQAANVNPSLDLLQLLALLGAALLIVLPAWALAAFAQRDPNPAAAVREGNA